jgi:hypothetical protein
MKNRTNPFILIRNEVRYQRQIRAVQNIAALPKYSIGVLIGGYLNIHKLIDNYCGH